MRQLLRRGRISLVIGLGFLGGCLALGELARRFVPNGWNNFAEVSLSIVGWVALWRPLEIYLYDWWPVRSDQRLLERLSRMRVRQILPQT